MPLVIIAVRRMDSAKGLHRQKKDQLNMGNTPGQGLPFKGGESCRVLVSDEPVLTGFIEVVEVSYDGSDHILNVSGRDKTGDLLDSSLDQFDDIRGDELSLKQVIESVISHLGLSITVTDEVNPPLFNSAEDIAAPEPGDNAFEFIERYSGDPNREDALTRARRVTQLFAEIPAWEETSSVPEDSLLREFIGGSVYTY